MKKLVLLLVVLTFISSAFAQKKPWRDGEMEVKILFHKDTDAQKLAAFNYDCDIYSQYAYSYLVPSEFEKIKAAGFDFLVLKADLNAWSASFGDALVPQGYYTFDQIKSIADSLAINFPSICKKVVFGTTALGKELAALKISDNVNIHEDEAEILFDGGIHGDEVGGSQNVIQFARDLCKNYGTDPQITSLVDNREIWLYYCVNPYGRDHMTRENGAGVDVNRDFGYAWGGEGSSPGPFSQPESKALRNCQYANQFVSYTNYHSGTEIISYPWSYRYSPAPDRDHMDHLAQVYSLASGYSNLPYGQGSVIMYLIQGSTKDYNYGGMGSVAWSIEISLDKQPTDVQYYYNINKPAMLALIENAGYGIQGVVTDAITGKPINASIYVGQNYPCYTDAGLGDFHKYLIAGTYSIKVVANGYESKTINNVVVNDLQCTTTNVQLNPLSCQYGYRVIATHIPGFNAQNPGDEGYSAACLGPPDDEYYSLGRGGYIIFDMQDTIHDGAPGSMDITVFEGGNTPEGYTLYAGDSMDGPWTNIGYATGTWSFNMEPYGVTQARYFMLLDDNNGQANVPDAGFDFDAIASLHPAVPDTVGHLSGKVFNAYTNQSLPGVSVISGDSSAVTDGSGSYQMNLIRGQRELCADLAGYRSECDTLLLQAGNTYTHNFYLFPTVGIKPLVNSDEQLKIAPNPFTRNVSFEFSLPVSELCTIKVYDLTGKVVSTVANQYFPAGLNTFEWDCQLSSGLSLQPGYYILSLKTPQALYQTKAVKAF